MGQIDDFKREDGRGGINNLNRLPITNVDGCSPDLVTPNDFTQTFFQNSWDKRAIAIEGNILVIERDFRVGLSMQPHLELWKRKRDDGILGTRRDNRLSWRIYCLCSD